MATNTTVTWVVLTVKHGYTALMAKTYALLNTPFGPLRTATHRRYILVNTKKDGTPYAEGYTDNPVTAKTRARKLGAVVVDRVEAAV